MLCLTLHVQDTLLHLSPLCHVSAKQQSRCPVHHDIEAVLYATQSGKIGTAPCQEAFQALEPDMLPFHISQLDQCVVATCSNTDVEQQSYHRPLQEQLPVLHGAPAEPEMRLLLQHQPQHSSHRLVDILDPHFAFSW